MNVTAPQDQTTGALKMAPKAPPPTTRFTESMSQTSPTFITHSAAGPAPEQTQKKDGFLAAAALGGMVAALAMVLVMPSGFFLVKMIKQKLNSAPAVEQVAEPPRVVEWPDVSLSGILAADGERAGSAILNGQLINLNQQILKVRVVALHNQQVVLEYDGDQKTLRVGENTQ